MHWYMNGSLLIAKNHILQCKCSFIKTKWLPHSLLTGVNNRNIWSDIHEIVSYAQDRGFPLLFRVLERTKQCWCLPFPGKKEEPAHCLKAKLTERSFATPTAKDFISSIQMRMLLLWYSRCFHAHISSKSAIFTYLLSDLCEAASEKCFTEKQMKLNQGWRREV